MRIVLKFGTGILTRTDGDTLDTAQFTRLTGEVAAAVGQGHQCMIVSSGAVGAGLAVMRLKERPKDLASVQACAAVGQSKLMEVYEKMFAAHGLHVAQLLLTHGDLDSRTRYGNVRNTLERLYAAKTVVPIINENDSVAVDELKFGDNDRLSAEVAMLADADLLIMLTSVDGVLDGKGNTISTVSHMDKVTEFVRDEKGRLSVGGMQSKLQAVKLATGAGIPTAVVSGRLPGQIAEVLGQRGAGTRFIGKGDKFTKLGWIS